MDDLQKVSIRQVKQTPWLIEEQGILKSETWLEIENDGAAFEGWVRITVPHRPPYMEHLSTVGCGMSRKKIHVAELQNNGDPVEFSIFENPQGLGEAVCAVVIAQMKIKHWKIYVAHDMHTDLGYTNYQEDLIHKIYPGYLERVFQYVEDTKGWPEDVQFRYPIEASFMLHGSALIAKDADWIMRLKEYLKAGRITYPFDYLHMATEGMGTEEIARQCYISGRYLQDRLGTGPVKVFVHTDDAGFSWSHVDLLVNAGVKYLSLRLQDANWNYSDGHCPKYPRLFYLKGRNPGSRLLVFDGPPYHFDDFGFRQSNSEETFRLIAEKLPERQGEDYPCDAYLIHLTQVRDNSGVDPNVMKNIRALSEATDENGNKYLYPRFINSVVEDFFEYIEAHFSQDIPAFQGTLESFWSFGAPQVAHETALSRVNHEKVPAAELYSTLACVYTSAAQYPYQEILRAYDNMLLTDEHTWACWKYYAADDQFMWMRNKAIQAERLADQLLEEAFSEIQGLIPSDGKTIVIYNPSVWRRTDLVKVGKENFPEHFEIIDLESGASVGYQWLPDGKAAFIAPEVPGLGYKCFRINPRKDDPVFGSDILTTGNSIENKYFRVTLDSTGSISSIIDKENGYREMVDQASPYKMNQFVYYTSRNELYRNDLFSEDSIRQASISAASGCVMGILAAEGTTRGADRIKRNIVLYQSIPRIDIINEVVKSDAPPDYTECAEEAFFVFPFAVSDFVIEHETPNGEIRPSVNPDIHQPMEQLYWSNTDFYAVNRWIDISDRRDYGITFSPVHAPLVQYGGRRTCRWDKDYDTPKPWVYSWIIDNFWKTNFPYTQPGPLTFKYSIRSHGKPDWRTGRADQFGHEVTNELKCSVIDTIQDGPLDAVRGSFINIDRDNVFLTAAKPAEANGEGIIFRFHETLGEDSSVTIGFSASFTPEEVWETDIVENDVKSLQVADHRISFFIQGHGWMTIRVKQGSVPVEITGVKATTDLGGTLVSWDEPVNPGIRYYEVFRDTTAGFMPGTGNYVASVTGGCYYDGQVTKGLSHDYYYRIRAAGTGRKGEASPGVKALPGEIGDTEPPSIPARLRAEAFGSNRVSLSWDGSEDKLTGVRGYRIYRNGAEIKDVTGTITSFLDVGLHANTTCEYWVRAYDTVGNISFPSEPVQVTTPDGQMNGNIAGEAVVTASSELGGAFRATNVADGIFGLMGIGEWVSRNEKQPWVQLNWSETRWIETVYIFGSYGDDHRYSGVLYFDDGILLPLESIRTDGSATKVTLGAKPVRWIRVQVNDEQGAGGLSEIQVIEEQSVNRG